MRPRVPDVVQDRRVDGGEIDEGGRYRRRGGGRRRRGEQGGEQQGQGGEATCHGTRVWDFCPLMVSIWCI
nr:hypothetical protein GCM10020092_039710 [Actinoplanes digitatis]